MGQWDGARRLLPGSCERARGSLLTRGYAPVNVQSWRTGKLRLRHLAAPFNEELLDKLRAVAEALPTSAAAPRPAPKRGIPALCHVDAAS